MTNIETEDANKFTLEYYLSAKETSEPPFQYSSNYLADVVAEGWRIQLNGGVVVAVSRGRESVISKDDLPEIYNRMAELGSSQAGLSPKEFAEQAIQKRAKNI